MRRARSPVVLPTSVPGLTLGHRSNQFRGTHDGQQPVVGSHRKSLISAPSLLRRTLTSVDQWCVLMSWQSPETVET